MLVPEAPPSFVLCFVALRCAGRKEGRKGAGRVDVALQVLLALRNAACSFSDTNSIEISSDLHGSKIN